MTAKIKIGGICERDVDLLLQEQFISSRHFCVWFAEKAGIAGTRGVLGQVKRSATDRTGESDLELQLDVGADLPALLLIENKITAQFQPMQAKRYRNKGEGRIRKSKIRAFRTVLVSPRKYFEGDLKGFDCRVSYEEIRDYLGTTDRGLTSLSEERQQYKLALLDAAIERQMKVVRKRTREFNESYWDLIGQIAPELMRRKKPPMKGDTVFFTDARLAPKIVASHRLAQGKFGEELEESLQYGNFDILVEETKDSIEDIRDAFKDVLPPHIQIVAAGESVAFRVAVPQILKADRLKHASDQAAARSAIYLGKDLYERFRSNKEVWSRFVKTW